MATPLSISQHVVKLRAPGFVATDPGEAPVDDRANRLPGYSADILEKLSVLLVGAGGLGSEIGHGLARNGIGRLVIADNDTVELSNLNRQKFYFNDLYKNKALQLARNLVPEAVSPSVFIGLAMTGQEAVGKDRVGKIDVVLCGVDNDYTRVFFSRWALAMRIPAIFVGVNDTADYGYVFVQKGQAKSPCFGCLFPDAVNDAQTMPCAIGSTINILKTLAGPALYALSALFMPRLPLRWHYKEISLSGSMLDGYREIPRRPDCVICHG